MNFNNHPLFKKLDSINFNQSDYTIFGSGPMFSVGIRKLDDLDDLDIVVNKVGWATALKFGESKQAKDWNCNHIDLFEGKIEIYDGWGPSNYNVSELIQNSNLIEGYNFANLKDVIKWKKEMGREKDLHHISIIDQYLKRKS